SPEPASTPARGRARARGGGAGGGGAAGGGGGRAARGAPVGVPVAVRRARRPGRRSRRPRPLHPHDPPTLPVGEPRRLVVYPPRGVGLRLAYFSVMTWTPLQSAGGGAIRYARVRSSSSVAGRSAGASDSADSNARAAPA